MSLLSQNTSNSSEKKKPKEKIKIPLIGVGLILEKHFITLVDDAHKPLIILYFFIIPFLITYYLLFNLKYLSQNSTNSLITSFSIFTGLLLNIILILYAIINRNAQINCGKSNQNEINKKKEVNRMKLLNHLYANSIYALLISTFILFLLMGVAIYDNFSSPPSLILLCISGLIYFIIIHFGITLLMIFRRLFILLFEPG